MHLIFIGIIKKHFFASITKKIMQKLKKEEHHREDQAIQDAGLSSLKRWMENVQPIKLIKISQDVMTKVLQNWSKFRITILKTLNEQQNRVLDAMAKLRKQVQWLNQVKAGNVPEINKLTSRLYKDCQQLQQKKLKFQIGEISKQAKLVADKIVDSVKTSFEDIKDKISELVEQFRQFSSIKEVLTQKTYFKFLQKGHHSEIQILHDCSATVHNQLHDMDFGAVIGPALTETNYKIGLCIERNDQYQCFIGVGVCHPKIVKQNSYKGSGTGSGCYIIRQQSDRIHAISLSHAYQKQGSHKKPKFLDWGFGQGDIILIQMDFKKGLVCFSKGEQYYEMKVDLDQGSVNPYVVLHSKWDCVTILNS